MNFFNNSKRKRKEEDKKKNKEQMVNSLIKLTLHLLFVDDVSF